MSAAIPEPPARQPSDNPSEQAQRTPYRFSVDEYEQMGAAGILVDKKVELLYGEIVSMTPPNPLHAFVVDQLMYWSIENTVNKNIWVRIQNSLGIPEFDSMPEPDVAWMVKRNYRKQHPQPDDVQLLIEVSDSSIRTDRSVKGKLYAQSGVQDYWIVNLQDLCVEVYRDPKDERYQQHQTFQIGQSVSPLAVPECRLDVSTLMQS